MLNRDVYVKLPEQSRLLNNGVAEVSEDRSEAAERVLRYEVATFVCSGQYEKGLQEILEKFILNLGSRTEQPGVWISGFYGSGKSHLAKMLRALWVDHEFSEGVTARGLAKLPTSVSDLLKELSTQSKRAGGLHAAAGNLGEGANASIRLTLLGIVFKSVGLPAQYHEAQFVMWLKREGLYDGILEELAAAGRTLTEELENMYVSDYLAPAIRKVRPGFADTDNEAKLFIEAQFPQVTDVSNDQLVDAITRALSKDGKFPLTLIVLDEVQQFIGDDGQKAYIVQEVTQTLSKRFSGQLLFVATGQSALSGTTSLQRLLGRFPVAIMLGDWDVENVTREIILAKKPMAKPEINQVLRSNLGEISRHLRGTKLEHVTADEEVLVADYPILPVRRRFWERVLRSIDTTGTVSQLRSQLRVVHEAVEATAELPLGHVVPADFLYDQIAATLVSTAQLGKEVYDNVQRFAAVGNAASQLKARLLKLIYLINKLSAETAASIGLHATEQVLADLLVVDLAAGSAELRKALPAILDELQNKDRLIMALQSKEGTEYRLQTRESSAWYEEFRAQEAEFKAAAQRVDVLRADELKTRFRKLVADVAVMQGKSNIKRTLSPVFDEALPKDHEKNLYVWIQDGWQTDEKSVIAEARAKGADNPTIFVFMKAETKNDIYNAIVAREAAEATLHKRGTPTTEEGREAQRSMDTRLANAKTELTSLLDKVFTGVRIFQAGGQEMTEGNDLTEALTRAGQTAAIRLYHKFDIADHEKWGKVLEEAQKGSQEALKHVGHTLEADKHPVCQKMLAYIGSSGKSGREIRDLFGGAPYGWERDAIDGALYTLLATGHLRATDSAGQPLDAKSLERKQLTQASFRCESITITPAQKIKIRTLFSNLGVPCQPGAELAKAPALITKLRELAHAASGQAPAPATPSTTAIETLEGQSGNALLLALFNQAGDLTQLAKQWEATAATIGARMPAWRQLLRLLGHAANLDGYPGIKANVDAVESQRSLLDEPDPVRPLLDQTSDLLRTALNARLQAYKAAAMELGKQLEADADWQKLTDYQKDDLVARHQLEPLETPDLSTPEALEKALEICSLQHWVDRTNALSVRFERARLDAAKLLKPNVVHVSLPGRTLNSADELKQWLAEVEALLSEKLKKGPVSL